MSGQALWYLTRGTGLVALVLLTGTVALGVLTWNGWSSHRWPRFITLGLHRNLSLLAVAFLGVHVASTVVDGFAPIGWLDVVVPFHSPYRPIWLGLGAVAVDLLIAVMVTSLLRRHLSLAVWRTVHLTAWAAWPIALVHGLGTGSDTTHGWVQLVYVASVAVVLACAWWRIAASWADRRPVRLAALVTSIVVPIAVLAWTATGPLHSGWARRSGTPSELLHNSSSATGEEDP
jgi:methionine sulfoxide reductase heme-binding subunit